MGLSDIAAGIEVVDEQRDSGVATVDRTTDSLAERLEPFAADLPCTPGEAAALVDAYAEGKSVGASARVAGIAPTDGAKALHLFGESVSPVGPMGREIVGDWLAGELPRTEAVELAGVSDQEFALAAYVETHEPIEGAMEAVEGALSLDGDGSVAKRDALGDTMDGVGDLRNC
ncbi:hypothetical protein ACFQMA_14350 [Halosimplex aquaticum]|uniref:Uncharacterized protein n=1 Tax=Halosimplex aquaticum TaxID=3026162 RepID=A0ABD5Y668_9EURY|nr:hypothetical protein [Halosimplex aquaticum]